MESRTSQELIKVTATENKQTVNARELHSFLESKQEFSNWFKKKVFESPYFTRNIDYFLLDKVVEQTGRGGHNRIDYTLTVETGKKVAMAEQTERGNKVRDYFIECEKRLSTFAIPQTFSQALLLASQQAEQIEQQNALLLEQKSKVEFHDAVVGSKTTADLGTVAKLLNYPGYGRNRLFDLLRSKRILMQNNRPFQRHVDSGCFRVIESHYMVKGEERISFKTVVFQKGVKMIKKILDEVTK